MIVAADEKYGIGKDGKIPWHYSSDLKFFKEYTEGKTVVMGTKTFESIGKPLKNRNNIVLSRHKMGSVGELEYCTLNQFFNKFYTFDKEFVVIGGEKIYKQFLEMDVVKILIMTHIPGDYNCDRFFPSVHLIKYPKYNERLLADGLKTSHFIRVAR